jgi:HD-like signal output (HDOD) protein
VGLWDWIVGTITGQTGARPRTLQFRPPRNVQTGAEAAVATLEEPATSSTEAEEGSIDRWWAPDGATLTELAELERPEMPHEVRAFENLLVSNFDGHDLTMPPMPRILERVLKLLRDRDCDFGEVAKVIGEDQVITAAVLRMTNSPLYRGLEKITALQPAITRLGARSLQTLMMHQAMRATAFPRKGGDQQLAELVWRSSLASACIMRGLAEFTSIDPEDAFLIGLLHDIGNVIVLRLVQSARVVGHYKIDLKTFEYLCFECHQEFGELIAAEWKLPERLRALIAAHHTYPHEDDPLRIERLQLQVSDMINAMIGYGPPAAYDLPNARPVRDLGMADRPDFTTFLAELPAELDDMMSIL